MKINREELDIILDSSIKKYNYFFNNTNFELMDSIIKQLKDKKFLNKFNIIIDLRKMNFNNIKKLESSIVNEKDKNSNLVYFYEHILISIIVKQLLEQFPDLNTKSVKNSIDIMSKNGIENNSYDRLLHIHDLQQIVNELNDNNINITINAFIDKKMDNNLFQSCLNTLLSYSYLFSIRFFCEGNSLINYISFKHSFIEEMNDYHEMDLGGINIINTSKNIH